MSYEITVTQAERVKVYLCEDFLFNDAGTFFCIQMTSKPEHVIMLNVDEIFEVDIKGSNHADL